MLVDGPVTKAATGRKISMSADSSAARPSLRRARGTPWISSHEQTADEPALSRRAPPPPDPVQPADGADYAARDLVRGRHAEGVSVGCFPVGGTPRSGSLGTTADALV